MIFYDFSKVQILNYQFDFSFRNLKESEKKLDKIK